jgi:hypothetical protein
MQLIRVLPAFILAFAAGTAIATPVEIARFGFNDSPISLNPTTGVGTCVLIGGVNPAASGASASTGSPDGGTAYNTDRYPAQGTGNGTGGFEFQVSTAGYSNVTFSFDGRTSNTASRFFQVYYSTDAGVTWVPSTNFGVFTNTNWQNNNLVDLSSDGAISNNPNARFRVVAAFEPSTSAYRAAGNTSTYNGTTGTFRIDGVIISGEPSTSTNPSGTPGATPAVSCEGTSVVLTVSPLPGQNPPSTTYTVAADLTSIGGSATQQFYDDGTNGDVNAFDNVFSFGVTASGGSGVRSVPFTVTDDQSRTFTSTISYGVGACGTNADSTVVISQVYGGGGSAGALWDGDFVELFNRSSAPVVLDGWSVQYASAAGVVSNTQVRALSGTIQPGAYYLARMSNQTGAQALPAPDAGTDAPVNGGILMSNVSGKVFLANIATPIAGCDDGAIVDSVGYGAAASCFEGGGAAPDLTGASPALMRKLNGCQDSDENFNDFEFVFEGAPRNSATTPTPCGGNPCPGNLCGDQDFNGDGDFGTDQDIEAFFACLGGTCCTSCFCQGSDFNGDGDFGTDQDIEAFFRVLGGGNC